jgi:hypothetical protein
MSSSTTKTTGGGPAASGGIGQFTAAAGPCGFNRPKFPLFGMDPVRADGL